MGCRFPIRTHEARGLLGSAWLGNRCLSEHGSYPGVSGQPHPSRLVLGARVALDFCWPCWGKQRGPRVPSRGPRLRRGAAAGSAAGFAEPCV